MLRSGSVEVDLDLVSEDRHGRSELEQAGRSLERIGGFVAPVRQDPDSGTHDALGVREELFHRGGDCCAATLRAELVDPAFGQMMRSKLRPKVPAALVRVPHLRNETLQRRAVEARRRNDDAFLRESLGSRGEASRLRSPHVRVVRTGDRVSEHRSRDDREVREVRPACIGIVEDPRLPWSRIVSPHGGDGFRHRAEVHRDVLGLGHHAAGLVEESGRAVAALLDVR